MTDKFREAATKMKQAVSGQYAARDKACREYFEKRGINASLFSLMSDTFNAGWAARKSEQYDSLLDKPKAACDRETQEWIADSTKQGK